jgi:hypothetical protein
MSTTVKSSSTLVRGAAIAAATALVAGSALLVGGAASADTITVPQGQTFPAESPALAGEPGYNYNTWHQGYTTAPALPQTVEADGLHISGVSQILKGYDTARTATTFSSVIDGASVTKTGDDVFLQIPLFNTPGTRTGYTTLYPTVAGSLDTWTTTSAIVGDDASAYPAGTATLTVAQLDAALGNFDVLGAGVLTTAGTAAVVSSFSLNGDTYQFAAPVAPPVAPSVTITPTTITPADFVDTTKGFTVNIVGFQPNEEITVGLTLPDGTVVGFADGANVFTVGADGSLVLPNLVLTGSGAPQLGVYTFSVTGTVTAVQTATITVANAAVVADAPKPQPKLANTGISDAPMFASAGLGLLLMGFAAFAITAVNRRRRNA